MKSAPSSFHAADPLELRQPDLVIDAHLLEEQLGPRVQPREKKAVADRTSGLCSDTNSLVYLPSGQPYCSKRATALRVYSVQRFTRTGAQRFTAKGHRTAISNPNELA